MPPQHQQGCHPGMELAQLRMFLAVADELHFRRAAERCHIAQPALSRRIQQLESELGVILFRRTKREVELTEAGRRFLESARDGVNRIDQGASEIKLLSDVRSNLRVAAVEYANFPFLPLAMRFFQQRHPGIPILRRDLHAAKQIEAIRSGDVDVGFHGAPHEEEDLAYERVVQAKWTIALPSTHVLANLQIVESRDLAGEQLVLFPRAVNPTLHDWIIARLQNVGITPEIVHEPEQLHTALGLVAAGLGVFPSPFNFHDHGQTGLVVRELSGFNLEVWVCAVYRRNDESKLLRAFLDAALRATKES